MTRAACTAGSRPCPLVSCRYNTYLDVNPATGRIKRNRPGREPWQVDPARSCVLDLADLGGLTLKEVGAALGMTRERVRQIEAVAILRLRVLGGTRFRT